MMELWSTGESLEHKEKEIFIDWENQYKRDLSILDLYLKILPLQLSKVTFIIFMFNPCKGKVNDHQKQGNSHIVCFYYYFLQKWYHVMSFNIILGHFTKVFRECFFDILQKNRCQLHAINEQKLILLCHWHGNLLQICHACPCETTKFSLLCFSNFHLTSLFLNFIL